MKIIRENALVIAWVTSLAAMAGSLYFSNVLHFPPCILCWYEGIAMYPLVAILAVGLMRKDRNVPYYALPLTIIGGLIAVFHNLLYYKILPESAAPCTAGVSCTTKFIEYFGFITIPFLSFVAFGVITACMMVILKSKKNV